MTVDTHGNLYGTTTYGRAYNDGTVWEFQAGSVREPSSLIMGCPGMVLVGGVVLMQSQRLDEKV